MSSVLPGLLLCCTALRAQEDAGVSFDPRTYYPFTSWQFLVGGALASTGLYLYWCLLKWLARRLRNRVNWKRLRYWWPTAMSVAGAVLIASERWIHGEDLLRPLRCGFQRFCSPESCGISCIRARRHVP